MVNRLMMAVGGFLLICVGVGMVIRFYDDLIHMILVMAGPVLGLVGLVLMFLSTVKDDQGV
jgi:hypothetical protein